MGSNSGFKRSVIIFILILNGLITPLYQVKANPFVAPAFAVVSIADLFSGVVARRAIQQAATGAIERLTLTRFAVSQAAKSALKTIPVASTLKIAGAVTWAGVAGAVGGYSVEELMRNDDSLKSYTKAVLIDPNTYAVDVEKEGVSKTIIVNFKPEELNPVFVYIESVTQGEASKIVGVQEGYNYPDNARFYITKTAYSAPYYFGDIYEDVAIQAQEFRTYSMYKPRYTDFSETVTNKIIDQFGNISFTEQDYKFRYVRSESMFDFDVVGVTEDSMKYNSSSVTHYHPDIEGLAMAYTVFVKVTTHEKNVNSSFEPCKTTTAPNGSTSTICSPPNEDDYSMSDSDFTHNLRVDTNSGYKIASMEVKSGSLTAIEPFFKDDLKSLPIDYEVLADIFNEIIYSASSAEGYEGVAYSTSTPITAAEIQAVAKAMGLNPTQYDLFYSTVSDGDMLSTVEKQYTTIINDTTHNDTNHDTGKEDVDYTFTGPELENIPTGFEVLAYLDNLFPFLRNFELTEKSASCPIGTFEAFGQTYTIDTHCPLLEENRTLFQTIMLIVWAFVSLRIILKA